MCLRGTCHLIEGVREFEATSIYFNIFRRVFACLQATADAKVVLWLCTPTYIEQDYPLVIITNIYKCDMNSEVL